VRECSPQTPIASESRTKIAGEHSPSSVVHAGGPFVQSYKSTGDTEARAFLHCSEYFGQYLYLSGCCTLLDYISSLTSNPHNFLNDPVRTLSYLLVPADPSMGPAINTDHRRKHQYPLSPPSSGSATAQSSPKLTTSAYFHFDESEIVHGLSASPFQGSDSRIVASCNKIDGNTSLSKHNPYNQTSYLEPTQNLTSMYPTRQPLSDQPLPVPKTIRPLSRGSSESSSSSSTPFTRDQISPPPSGRKVADSLQLFKETEDPKPSDVRPDSYKLHRPVSLSKADGVAEAQFEFVKRSEWPDRESAAERRERSTTTLERMWTRDSNGSLNDADIRGGKERKTVRDNVSPQRRRDLLGLQDSRGRRRERVSEEGVFDSLSGPGSPISPRDPHDRALPPSTFGHLRSRVYPPSPSPSRSPKCRVPSLPPLNISKPSTRSPSLPSENPALQDTIAISPTACPLQSLPVRHSSPGPSSSALDSYSPWSTDDESNWESASVATSTSTTSAASDFPLSPPHASTPTPFLHYWGSDRGDGEPVVASNYATMLSEPLDGADEADLLDLDEFPPSSLPPIPLRPFPNQVGGHKAIYKFTKRAVCKVRAFLVIDMISTDTAGLPCSPWCRERTSSTNLWKG
jgi:inositol-hexakisphosphate kinase